MIYYGYDQDETLLQGFDDIDHRQCDVQVTEAR